MATSLRPLALLAVLVISVGWGRQTCARAQYIKGGQVKGTIKGGSGKGSSLFYNEVLGGGSAGSGATKGFSSVTGILGGTKGGVTMTKGGIASLGTKGGAGTLSLESSIDGENFMAKQALTSGLKGGQASTGNQQTQGFLKGSLGLSAPQSQHSSELKGTKGSSRRNGAVESQLSKGFVKSAAFGNSKQTQQNLGFKGGKGGQELWSKGLTKGSSLASIKQGQSSNEETGAKASRGFKGRFSNQWGTKGFVKGSSLGSLEESQQLSPFQKGGTSLRGQESRFANGQSFSSLQDKQQSDGTKGFNGGSAIRLLEKQTSEESGQRVRGGTLGLGGDTQQSRNQRSLSKGGAGNEFGRPTSRFSSMSGDTEQTQQSSMKRLAQQVHQTHVTSFKAAGIMRAVHFQHRPRKQISFAKTSFSGHRWSSKRGFRASGQSFSPQFPQSGGKSILQQQRQALSVGQHRTEAVQGPSSSDSLQHLQFQTGQSQKRRVQRVSDGQRDSVGSALTGQQKRVGQISQSNSISHTSKIQQGSQPGVDQQSQSGSLLKSGKAVRRQSKPSSEPILGGAQLSQQRSSGQGSPAPAFGSPNGQLSDNRAFGQLSKQSVIVPSLTSAAVSQQKASQQLEQAKETATKTSFSLGSLNSASQQKTVKGFLQQKQQ